MTGKLFAIGVLCSVVFVAAAHAATWYVTPAGAGAHDGSDWDNACTNLQDAINASNAGDTIYLKSGIYTNGQADIQELSQYLITGKTNLTISGGYAGSGAPGVRDGQQTILKRNAGFTRRLINASGSTLTLDTIVIDDGKLTANGSQGAGLRLVNCNTTITNSILRNNFMLASGSAIYYGGAIYASGGSLDVIDSDFTGNYLKSAHDNSHTYGGAINANSTTIMLEGCTFNGNYITTPYHNDHGGALYLSGGSASINDCHFYTNYITMHATHTTTYGYGGAIYANNVAPLHISDSSFAGSYAIATAGQGGVLYLAGNSLRASLSRCALVSNCQSGNPGAIYIDGGAVTMENFLLARSGKGPALTLNKGNLAITNATFAANTGYGIRQNNGTLAVSHAIFALNTSGDINQVLGALSVEYSCLQSAKPGTGNFVADPLLADTIHCHPRSRAGHYTDGFFKGGSWTTDPTATSPTIDAAAPASVWTNEPQPNGHWANIGYDANTVVASKSDLGEPPAATNLAVYAYPPTNITDVSAWARGEVAHTGNAENPGVYITWETSDKGTASLDDWLPNVRHLGTKAQWELFATQLTGLPTGTNCYRLYATNSTGSAWSAPAMVFQTVPRPAINNLAVTHINRHSAMAQFDLQYCGDVNSSCTVRYWVNGGATTNDIPLGPADGHVATPLSGLPINTNCGVRVVASNSTGSTTNETTFATLDATPIARYVTPTGSGIADGSNWDNAYNSLLDALDVCRYPNDTIYLKSGTYVTIPANINDLSHYQISGIGPLTISGGYAGDGMPGAKDGRSVLKRDTGTSRRLFDIANATVVFDSIVIDDGKLTASDSQGAGMRLANCNVSLTNCIVRNNSMTGGYGFTFYGGGIYATASTLTAIGCHFNGNFLYADRDNSYAYGGAINANSTTILLEGCTFNGNYLSTPYHNDHGGALYLNGGSTAINDCHFYTNYISMDAGHSSTWAYGGAIYANATTGFKLSNSYFAGNYEQGVSGRGGTLYFEGAAQKAIVDRCVFVDNGQAGHSGSIHLQSGTLAITNAVVARNGKDDGIRIAGGTATLMHITTVGNKGWGVNRTSGTASLQNSIAWSNTVGGVSGCTVSYTLSQEAIAGEGNITNNPAFADYIYYHPVSRAGCYAGGYFDGGAWQRIKLVSPAVDAGNPASPYDLEPYPHGKRANLGAYGNTPVASQTYRPGGSLITLR